MTFGHQGGGWMNADQRGGHTDPPERKVIAGMDDLDPCPLCEGTGVYYRLPGDPGRACAVCNGTGKIGPNGEPPSVQ